MKTQGTNKALSRRVFLIGLEAKGLNLSPIRILIKGPLEWVAMGTIYLEILMEDSSWV